MIKSMKSGANGASLTRQTVRLYIQQAMRMPVRFIGGYIASLLFVLAGDIALPYVLGSLIDALMQQPRNEPHIYFLLWMLIGMSLLSFAFGRLTFLLRNPVVTTTERNLSMLVFDAFQRQEYGFFANNFVGSLVARSQRFVSTFKDLFDNTMFPLLSLVVQFVVPVIILSFKAPLLAAVFAGAVVLSVVVARVTSSIRTPTLRANAERGSEVTGALADVLTNSLAVKVFGETERERERFYGVAELRRQAFWRQAQTGEVVRIWRSFIAIGFQISSAVLLVWLALHGRISVGMIVMVQLYLMRLQDSLWNTTRISERLEEGLADAAEMTEVILRQPQVVDPADPEPLRMHKGDITFEGITFRYDDATEEQVLFRNLSLRIEPGQKVGLVGPSGGGKTTLTKLLLRFMDIDSGAITIDGQDIASVRQDDVRRAIAYVPQEPLLFHRSIRENIAYGRPGASDKDIERAAKLAHAHEFISKLPQGYDTLVGERGVKLSGGEKQRVAIARAMLKKAPIVVLD